MNAFVLAAALAVAPAPPVEVEASAPAAAGRRSGLYGWGLGLELPMVGVNTGLASHSSVGWGYTLGGALSWEVTPRVVARLFVSGAESFLGESTVSYVEGLEERRAKQPADWVGAEIGLGGAYQWSGLGRSWAPYVGGDVGLAFSGFFFELDDEHQSLRAIDIGDAFSRCIDEACRNISNDGLSLGFTAGVRGGVRLDLVSWLATTAELGLMYQRLPEERVSNTVAARDVRTLPENVLLARLTFSARLGL